SDLDCTSLCLPRQAERSLYADNSQAGHLGCCFNCESGSASKTDSLEAPQEAAGSSAGPSAVFWLVQSGRHRGSMAPIQIVSAAKRPAGAPRRSKNAKVAEESAASRRQSCLLPRPQRRLAPVARSTRRHTPGGSPLVERGND